MPELSDEDLAREAASGSERSEDALSELIRRNYSWILRLCLFEVRNRETAKDCAQECMLRMTKGLKNFRGDSSFRTWLFALARRTVRRTARKEWLRAELSRITRPGAEPQRAAPSVEELLCLSEQSKAVCGLVRRLPAAQRHAVYLHYFEDLSVLQTAERMSCSQSAVKTHLSRARTKIRGWIEQEKREVFIVPGGADGR